MLGELRIRDYALIDRLTVEFSPGLNVITGETGAGKSIILGALSLVLGERPDSSMIRTGADSATVEARFENVASLTAECVDLGLDVNADEEPSVLLRRRSDRNGRGGAWANDSPVTVASLRRLGDRLVDLHGQHQHQLLLRAEVHLEILDAYAGLGTELGRFAAEFDRLQELKQKLADLESDSAARRERRDLTEYQYRELSEVGIGKGELAALELERELLTSAEKRYSLTRRLEQLLSEQEGSVSELLAAAATVLNELTEIDPALQERQPALADAQSLTDDLWRELVAYRENIQFSPARLEEVNGRAFLIEKLASKHRVDSDELVSLTARLKEELDAGEFDDTKREELEDLVNQKATSLLGSAAVLSKKRRSAASRLERKLATEFHALGLEKALLKTRFESDHADVVALTRAGADQVEFLFSANPGEDARPLRKVASGGELSRIMLALKNVLAAIDPVPTMVFDEVDVGIGGRVAEAVGRRLARLGRSRQVVCITHLPQIAKYAARHFVAEKKTRGGRTTTTLLALDDESRVQEMARMVAGSTVSATSLKHAQEMLSEVSDNGR